MAHVLEGMGLSCIEAGSGAEALTILQQTGEVPLLVSDVSMPGLDGLGLLREVRRRFPDMAVVMLSGVREAETAVDCLLAGASTTSPSRRCSPRSAPGCSAHSRSVI